MEAEYEDGTEYVPKASSKQSNVVPLWGNERTMNLNPLILTNIQSSHYFKVNLYELKTYHEVVDEIYYQVSHLEPWEKGSRRTSGQTGMCGGVRGVGAGGIVSTAYCLLYKLFTLKLTRKQLNGLLEHCDSPYIRALGFMYIRYTQHPQSLIDWFDPYLEDEEEIDVKAGGGQVMTVGVMLRQWLVKLEWFSTLFPRIPVPIQQRLQKHLQERFPNGLMPAVVRPEAPEPRERPVVRERYREEPPRPREREYREREPYKDRDSDRDREREPYKDRDSDRDRERERYRERTYDQAKYREREKERDRSSRDRRSRERHHGGKHHDRHNHHKERDRGHSREREYSNKSRSRR